MTFLEYGIRPQPASNLRRLAPALPYLAVLVGLYGLSSAWAAIIMYQAGTIAFVMAIRDTGWRRWFRGWSTGSAMVLALFGAAGGVLLYVLWPWLDLDGRLAFELSRLGLSGTGKTIFLIYFALAMPWTEEPLWRGYLAGNSRRPELCDFLFAGYHALVLQFFFDWTWVILATAILTLAGWVWRRMAMRSGGLLLPIFSHAAADASIVVVLLIMT